MADTITLASGSVIKNYKSRTFSFVLYPDTNSNHGLALDRLRQNYNYLAILHDKDVNEDGIPKAPHWHCVVKFRQPRWLSALSDELTVEANLFEDCRNLDGYARYMLHMDHPEKAQYEYDSMEGSLKNLVEAAIIGKESESDRLLRLMDLLDSLETVVSMRAFVRLVCAAGLYADCRRAGYLMKTMLDEHNREVAMFDVLSDA